MKPALTSVFLFLLLTINAQNYNKLWQKVEQYELKGEIQNANKLVDRIYNLSSKKKHSQQLIKSFIYISKFDQVLEENSQLKFIERIEKEISKNTFPTNAILENIYANFLKEIYYKDLYKINSRSDYEGEKNIECRSRPFIAGKDQQISS